MRATARLSIARGCTATVIALVAALSCESATEPTATSLRIGPPNLVFASLGETVQLAAEVRDQNGQVMIVSDVIWKSSTLSVVSVDAQGKATSTGHGEAVIYATSGAATGAAPATVTRPVHSVVVTPIHDTISIGDSLRLTAQALYEDGSAVPNAEFLWKTSNPVVAGMEPGTGLATGKTEGEVTVTATIQSREGSARIRVVSADWAALVALYQDTDGDNWERKSGWLTDRPLGQWAGVLVDDQARVTHLDLYRNNLNGPIPPEIGQLSELLALQLSHNNLTGPVPPGLATLQNLSRLDLSGNRLSGPMPAAFGNLRKLGSLLLNGNNFTGRIPSSFQRLSNLTRLYLQVNKLTGPIPPSLSNLTELAWLYLGGNDLTGRIPAELANLSKLYQLGLGSNRLTGPIPPELGKLSNLQSLNLGSNQLTGPVPPELGSLRSLTRLQLSHNNLKGAVPVEFGELRNMWRLYLSHNPQMSGALPSGLASMHNLTVLQVTGTGLCAPSDSRFTTWLSGLEETDVPPCTAAQVSSAGVAAPRR